MENAPIQVILVRLESERCHEWIDTIFIISCHTETPRNHVIQRSASFWSGLLWARSNVTISLVFFVRDRRISLVMIPPGCSLGCLIGLKVTPIDSSPLVDSNRIIKSRFAVQSHVDNVCPYSRLIPGPHPDKVDECAVAVSNVSRPNSNVINSEWCYQQE